MPSDDVSWSMECSPTTIQYRLNLARALLAASPALSALHTTRAAALHPEISAILPHSHCPRCGTYRFSGDHPIHPPTRNLNKRKRATPSQSKSLQIKCHLCGFSVDVGAPIGSPLTDDPSVLVRVPGGFPGTETTSSTSETGQGTPLADTLHRISETIPIAVSTSAPPLPARQYHPKSSRTKALALKDMLSRDRQREGNVKARRKEEDGHEGLAAFLKQL